MSIARDAFVRRSWVWWVPLIFVVLMFVGILIYQTAFAGETEFLEGRLEAEQAQLEELRAKRLKVERFLEDAQAQSDATNILFRDHFSTEAERFTQLLREVRQLASRSGLSPSAFSYPQTDVEDQELSRRQVNFAVEGSYDQLRTFINLLELTDQFLALESVNLGGGANERDPKLKIRLSLSTYFIEDLSALERNDVSLGSSVRGDASPLGDPDDGGTVEDLAATAEEES